MKVKVKSKKKKAQKKDRVKEYYDSLDLMTWWESFNGDCHENGTRRYRTVWAFICAKSKEDWKRKFLYWLLGPKGTTTEYSNYEQFDWDNKRANGRWYASPESDRLSNELKNKSNALEAMKEVGKVNISFINRLEALMKEIDDEYSGRLFLTELSAKENHMRAQTYLMLLSKAQEMMQQAQIMFGRTNGIDLERLDLFFSMLTQGVGAAQQAMGFAGNSLLEGSVEKVPDTISQIQRMIMAKAAERELELPDKDMEDIILGAGKLQVMPRKG